MNNNYQDSSLGSDPSSSSRQGAEEASESPAHNFHNMSLNQHTPIASVAPTGSPPTQTNNNSNTPTSNVSNSTLGPEIVQNISSNLHESRTRTLFNNIRSRLPIATTSGSPTSERQPSGESARSEAIIIDPAMSISSSSSSSTENSKRRRRTNSEDSITSSSETTKKRSRFQSSNFQSTLRSILNGGASGSSVNSETSESFDLENRLDSKETKISEGLSTEPTNGNTSQALQSSSHDSLEEENNDNNEEEEDRDLSNQPSRSTLVNSESARSNETPNPTTLSTSEPSASPLFDRPFRHANFWNSYFDSSIRSRTASNTSRFRDLLRRPLSRPGSSSSSSQTASNIPQNSSSDNLSSTSQIARSLNRFRTRNVILATQTRAIRSIESLNSRNTDSPEPISENRHRVTENLVAASESRSSELVSPPFSTENQQRHSRFFPPATSESSSTTRPSPSDETNLNPSEENHDDPFVSTTRPITANRNIAVENQVSVLARLLVIAATATASSFMSDQGISPNSLRRVNNGSTASSDASSSMAEAVSGSSVPRTQENSAVSESTLNRETLEENNNVGPSTTTSTPTSESSTNPSARNDTSFGNFLSELRSGLLATELSNSLQNTNPRRAMNFVRIFQFSPNEPRTENGVNMVPVLIVGVRSADQNSRRSSTQGDASGQAANETQPSQSALNPPSQTTSNLNSASLSQNQSIETPRRSILNNESNEHFNQRVNDSFREGNNQRFPLFERNLNNTNLGAFSLVSQTTNLNSNTSTSTLASAVTPPVTTASSQTTDHRTRTRAGLTIPTNLAETGAETETGRRETAQTTSSSSLGSNVASDNIPTRQSWMVYVFGGTYPENHPVLLRPNILSEDASYEDLLDFEALLGQVKPPVATEEELKNAGGLFKIGEEGLDQRVLKEVESRCLICLSDFEKNEECRKLELCGHAFHRICVDQWLTTGRNSCPKCRTEGVKKLEVPTTESDPETDFLERNPFF